MGTYRTALIAVDCITREEIRTTMSASCQEAGLLGAAPLQLPCLRSGGGESRLLQSKLEFRSKETKRQWHVEAGLDKVRE